MLAPALFSLGLLISRKCACSALPVVRRPGRGPDCGGRFVHASPTSNIPGRVGESGQELRRCGKLHPVQLTVSNLSASRFMARGCARRPAGRTHCRSGSVRRAPDAGEPIDGQLSTAGGPPRGVRATNRSICAVASRLGLWQAVRSAIRPARECTFTPGHAANFAEYAIFWLRADRLNLLGVRRTWRVGQDNEFERHCGTTLRDDNYRFIDWAQYCPPPEAHGQGLSGQPESAGNVPDRLRTDDVQYGGRAEPARSCAQRDADAQLCRPA